MAKTAAMKKALQKAKDNHPAGRLRVFNTSGFMNDPEAFGELMAQISSGYSISAFVTETQLPKAAVVALNRALAKLKSPDPRFDDYQVARQARASQFAERMIDVVDQVEMGLLTPQQASMMTKTLMWLAARLDPSRWTERVQVDATVKLDTASAHLEAVRAMATMVRNDSHPVIDVVPEVEADGFDHLLD